MSGHVYLLMNKNQVIQKFRAQRDSLTKELFFTTISHYTDSYIPIGHKNIDVWVKQRQAPKQRKHIKGLLQQIGCDDYELFLQFSHGLSLNDTFWVQREDENLTWEELSLYQNPFDEAIARIAFQGGLYREHFSSVSPEFVTDGTFAKCWIKEDDGIYLYKQGSHGTPNAGREPYSEFYSSQIADILLEKPVFYDLKMFCGELVSTCKLFTSEKTGYVPYGKFVAGERGSVCDMLNFYHSIGSEDAFRRMVVNDAVIINCDRHLFNFGVEIDNDTQEILGMAHTIDHNKALLPYIPEDGFRHLDEYLSGLPCRIGEDFNEMAHNLLTPKIMSDLKNLRYFTFTRHNQYNLPEKRLWQLEQLVTKQIDRILHCERL